MSINEAKVYSSIVEHGNCDTTFLAKITGLPRTRIYDILSKLAAKNLLERGQQKGSSYHLIPPSESIEIVLKKLKKEFEFKEQAILELGNHLQSVYNNGIASELTPGVSILEFRKAEVLILQQLKRVVSRAYISISADSKSIDWRKSASTLALTYTSGLDLRYLVSSKALCERLQKSVSAFPDFAKIPLKFGYNEELYSSFILLDNTIFLFFLGHKDHADLTTLVLMTGSEGLVKSFEWMFSNLWYELRA